MFFDVYLDFIDSLRLGKEYGIVSLTPVAVGGWIKH